MIIAFVLAIIAVVIAYEFYIIPVPTETTDTFMIKFVYAFVKLSSIKVYFIPRKYTCNFYSENNIIKVCQTFQERVLGYFYGKETKYFAFCKKI